EAVKAMKEQGIDFSSEYAEHGLAKTIKIILGDGEKKPNDSELVIGPQVRKSMIATKHINKGEKLTENNIDILRPEGGLHPRYWDLMLEKGIASQDIKPEEFITTEKIDFEK
ncbi:MAG: hypothetical protein KKG59_07510, partial [Nanoarchaeota archaeon]|nr:hypothetical protein [Nanoarchaeota archaeon]